VRTVPGGSEPLQARLGEDVKIGYYPSEEPTLKAYLTWDEVRPPILPGARVGAIRIVGDGESVLAVAPLFAENRVEMTWRHRLGLVVGRMGGLLAGPWKWIFIVVNLLFVPLFYRSRKAASSQREDTSP
jgi:hypothetical protein